MADPEFEFLGPYKVGEVIGRGGMGSVYRATHARSGELVAVKLIAQHVADDMRFRRRFDSEVETLKRLRHPGIVRLIGYGEERGRLFYSMEYVQGQTLQQRIREVKRLGWLPAIEVAIQVCAALKHAHDIGVIHRDLKPANLLLTDSGEVKLVDFGIAKLFGFGEQTLSGSVLGTADYMAPEQAGTGKITPRTDLYALGSVMYAMMAGRSPFAGKKLTQVIESLKRDRPVPLDLINPDIPEEVVEIVHQLLEKDPADRPPTALAVMNRLKATRAGLQRERTVDLLSSPTDAGTPTDVSVVPLEGSAGGDGDTENRGKTDSDAVLGGDRPTDATGHPESGSKTVPRRATDQGNASVARGRRTQQPASDLSGTAVTRESAVPGGPEGTASPDAAVPGSSAQSPDRPPDGDDDQVPEPISRFETVDEHSSPWLSSEQTDSTVATLWKTLPLVGMLIVLAIGVYLFMMATRTPSADALFSMIRQAHGDGELTLFVPQMDRFLAEYPDDTRAGQVQEWQDQVELERTIRRLQARARIVGSTAQLPPAQQAFLRAMEARQQSRSEAVDQLQAWLDVFDPVQTDVADATDAGGETATDRPVQADGRDDIAIDSSEARVPTDMARPANDDSSAEEDPEAPAELARDSLVVGLARREWLGLAELVRQELARLRDEPPPEEVDSRLQLLEERLRRAETLPDSSRRRMLHGLIRLYQDQTWAEPIVRRAEQTLADSSDP